MTKKAEQSVATRGKLIKVARTLFGKRGFAGTSIEEVTRRAKVTRGALYHHFPGKEALFQAVFEQVEDELTERIVAAGAEEKRADKRLLAGLDAFLDACLEQELRQIGLLDAPAVLGWQKWHDIDADHTLGLLRLSLEAAMDSGDLAKQPVEPLAQLILGACNEAGQAIARADDVAAARRAYGESLSRLLEGLRPR